MILQCGQGNKTAIVCLGFVVCRLTSGRRHSRGYRVLRQYLSLFRPPVDGQSEDLSSPKKPNGCPASLQEIDVLQQLAGLGIDIVSLQRHTGELEDCAFSANGFFGLQRDDLLAGGFMERVHVADRPACLSAFSQAFHGSRDVVVELRLRGISPLEGEPAPYVWLEMSCSCLQAEQVAEKGKTARDDKGKDRRMDKEQGAGLVLCAMRDITQRKQLEDELAGFRARLEEQLEINKRLLSGTNHELRTPLNAIIGFSEMMMMPGLATQNEQQMIEYAGIIHDSGRHLLDTLDEVCVVSRFDAGTYRPKPRDIAIADLVRAGLELVQTDVEKQNIRLSVDDFAADLQINSDWCLGKHALAGMVAACLKAGPEGRLALHVCQSNEWIEIVVTGSFADPALLANGFGSGGHLQEFVELLQAELDFVERGHGCQGMVLRIWRDMTCRPACDKLVVLERDKADMAGALKKSA